VHRVIITRGETIRGIVTSMDILRLVAELVEQGGTGEIQRAAGVRTRVRAFARRSRARRGARRGARVQRRRERVGRFVKRSHKGAASVQL
jgi:hypothetical protein